MSKYKKKQPNSDFDLNNFSEIEINRIQSNLSGTPPIRNRKRRNVILSSVLAGFLLVFVITIVMVSQINEPNNQPLLTGEALLISSAGEPMLFPIFTSISIVDDIQSINDEISITFNYGQDYPETSNTDSLWMKIDITIYGKEGFDNILYETLYSEIFTLEDFITDDTKCESSTTVNEQTVCDYGQTFLLDFSQFPYDNGYLYIYFTQTSMPVQDDNEMIQGIIMFFEIIDDEVYFSVSP